MTKSLQQKVHRGVVQDTSARAWRQRAEAAAQEGIMQKMWGEKIAVAVVGLKKN